MNQIPKDEDSSDGGEKVLIDEEAEEEQQQEEEMGMYLKEGEYNVEKIVGMKKINGKKHYLVKWEGFPSSQNTWEPVEHLEMVKMMIKQFEKDYEEKQRAKPELPKIQTKRTNDNSATKTKESKENKNDKRKSIQPLDDEITTKRVKQSLKIDTGDEEELVITLDQSDSQEKASIADIETSEVSSPTFKKREAKQKNEKKTNGKVNKNVKVVKETKEAASKKVTNNQKKKDKVGSFKNKDKPKEILGIRPGKDGEFYFLVEWEMRSDGVKPENSHVSNAEFRNYDTKFLLDFYESKIVIFAKKKTGDEAKFIQESDQHISESHLQEIIESVRKPSISDSKEKSNDEADVEVEIQDFETNLNVEENEPENIQSPPNEKQKSDGSEKKFADLFYPGAVEEENDEKKNNRTLEEMERELEDQMESQRTKFMNNLDY